MDGPHQPYPTARPNGRGPQRPVVPHRRRLRSAQPKREALRIAQAALGLGGHNPRPLAAASGRGVRAFLLARCPEVLLAPVPGGGRASPFLLAPQGAQDLRDDLARLRLFGDLAYRSEALGHALAECGISLVSQRADQHGQRQRIEIALSSLKRAFGLDGRLATTLVGLASRIAAKIAAYTYGFQVNRLLGRAQGRIKELWA